MATTVEAGSRELRELARRLKAAGRNDLRKEVLRGIRESNKGTIRKVRANAEATLPKRGGLAALVAKSKIATRTRISGTNIGVKIRGTEKATNLNRLNYGKLRHPVFGNRSVWKEQTVKRGWFSEPIRDDIPHILASIKRVVAEVNAKIERGL
jgi:hypothetical protein